MRDRTIVLAAAGAGLLIVGVGAVSFRSSFTQLIDLRRVGVAHRVMSQSMAPTLAVGDHFVTLRLDLASARRGTIVLYRHRGIDWISRIAGLPGDTVELRGGAVLINGKPAPQRVAGAGPTLDDGRRTQLLTEQFPGEAGSHRILQTGEGAGRAMPPATLPAGQYFLLNDNRDNALDGRLATNGMGPGLAPASWLIGQIQSIYWASDGKRIGKPLDLPAPAGR